MRIRTKFDIGQILFLKTDSDQLRRMVTSITLNPGNIVYGLSCGTGHSKHYEIELSAEADVLIKTDN